MKGKSITLASAFALSLLTVGCADTAQTNANIATNANTVANMNTMATTGEMRTAPDESEITTREEGDVRTEVRTFRNPNSPVERVEVTTRNNRRTARVYSRTGEARDLPESEVENALESTGAALAGAAGFAANKAGEAYDTTKNVAGEVVDETKAGARAVSERTVEGARTVRDETAEGVRTATEKTAEGARKAGEKTAEGAKKVGNAIKNAVDQ